MPAVEAGGTKEQCCVQSHISAAETALRASRAEGTDRENAWCLVLEDDTSPQKDTDMMNDVQDIVARRLEGERALLGHVGGCAHG